jgi:hypothetical protein
MTTFLGPTQYATVGEGSPTTVPCLARPLIPMSDEMGGIDDELR